jgi:hypothetical protein
MKNVGILKAKRQLSIDNWCSIVSNNQKDGQRRSEEYGKRVLDGLESQLSQMEQRLRVSCSEMGFDKNKTDQYIESWMETIKPWPNN